MKIIVFNDVYPPNAIGGYELRCKEVVEALKSRGHIVYVVTTKERNVTLVQDEKIYRCLCHNEPRKAKNVFQYIWIQLIRAYRYRKNYRKSVNLIKRLNPDVVYAWQMWTIGFLPLVYVQRKKIPIVFHVGDYWLSDFRERLLKKGILKKILRYLLTGVFNINSFKFDNILVVSEALRRECVAVGFDPNSIKVLPLVSRADLLIKPTKNVKKELGEVVRMMYVGRLVETKGVDVAILSIFYLKKKISNKKIRLEIVGAGDANYIKYLRSLVLENKLEKDVFLKGYLSPKEVKKLYMRTDIILFPSIWEEPFSVTVLEAMATGVPIIATTTGGTPEIVKDRINGMLVPPSDSVKMAEAAHILIQNGDLYNTIRENGVETIRDSYNFDDLIIQYEKILLQARAGDE